MTIETKFNIGDDAWLMNENKCFKTEVTVIEITIQDDGYEFAKKLISCKTFHFDKFIPETSLFKTKEELLASL